MEVTDLWKMYEEGCAYQDSLGLGKTIAENVRFYQGAQWAAPTEATQHLPRPVINLVKMVVRSKKAAILATPVKLVFSADDNSDAGRIFTEFSDFIQKEMKQDELDSRALRDGILKGSYFYHYYWDGNAAGVKGNGQGALRCDIINPLNIFFANPSEPSEQNQKWILIASREECEEVKAKADQGIDRELITADEAEKGVKEQENSGLCTVLTRYFRKDGEVWCEKAVKRTMINAPFCMTPDVKAAEKRLKLSHTSAQSARACLYPVVAGSYEEREGSIFGISEAEGLVPNQKSINLTMAMQILSTQRLAWGKYIVKKDALKNQDITDEPGQVLVDYSADGDGIRRLSEPGFSAMPLQIVNTLSDLTRSATGATDVIMGENYANLSGTAIARLQSQANQPIEELRARFWRVKEKQGRVLEQFFKLYYKGARFKRAKTDEEEVFDGEEYQKTQFALVVEPVSGTRASSAGDINMLDNLLARGDITVLTYLENYPKDALCNKEELLADVRKQNEEKAVALAAQLDTLTEKLKQMEQKEKQSDNAIDAVTTLIAENRRLKESLAETYGDAVGLAEAIGNAVKGKPIGQ